ncbi:MAG: pentapeptide repeat-containing protein [Candidatus Aureabacteria bacterium]|nr:pentapeptide repeat-containing protein [Candidatus Auribacterota bacterium]
MDPGAAFSMSENPILLSRFLETGQTCIQGQRISVDKSFEANEFRNLAFYQSQIEDGSFKGSIFCRLDFKLSHGRNLDFQNAIFKESTARNYSFSQCRFSKARWDHCDFSGGAFQEADFEDAIFEYSDFALCEFQQVQFRGARFIHCNFNGCVFEKADFENAVFEDVSFLQADGLTEEQRLVLSQKGAKVSLPYEIAFREWIHAVIINKWSHRTRLMVTAILFFILGIYAKPLFKWGRHLFKLEANPLSHPISYLQTTDNHSFFDRHISLPNYHFKDDLDYWLLVPNTPSSSDKLKPDREDFSSFPASLCSDGYEGSLYYSSKARPFSTGHDPLTDERIWLEVNPGGEKIKLSFYYKLGHPQINLYGRLKTGGYRILAQVDRKTKTPGPVWTYYSEEVNIPASIEAICLEISRFPEQKIYLDDINLEAAL